MHVVLLHYKIRVVRTWHRGTKVIGSLGKRLPCILITGILMKIITLFTIQDYLQDTIDKINIRNFIKIQNHV